MKGFICVFLLFILWAPATVIGQNFQGRVVLGEKIAREEVKKTLTEKARPFYDTLITAREMAIAIAEPILFKIYGQKNIVEERPYEVYLIEGYWYISGTLPKGYLGGTFLIIMNSENAQVVKLSHGK